MTRIVLWDNDFPEEKGLYWFYGKPFGGESRADYHLVKVRKISNGFMYITDGQFLYEGQGSGVWCKAIPPQPPGANHEYTRGI